MPKHITSAVIFDFNGVMVDDFPLQLEAWSQLSVQLRGVPVTYDEMVKKIRGVPTKDTLQWMSAKPLTDIEMEELAKKKDAIIEELFTTSPLFHLSPGLEAFLDALKERDIPRTIATSSRQGIFTFSFNRLGLAKWFDSNLIIFNDGSYPGKPAPDPYILAAKKIGYKPMDCVVIEDAFSGIQSAYAAGVKNIVVIGDDNRLEILGTLPGVIKGIHTFTELSVEELFA